MNIAKLVVKAYREDNEVMRTLLNRWTALYPKNFGGAVTIIKELEKSARLVRGGLVSLLVGVISILVLASFPEKNMLDLERSSLIFGIIACLGVFSGFIGGTCLIISSRIRSIGTEAFVKAFKFMAKNRVFQEYETRGVFHDWTFYDWALEELKRFSSLELLNEAGKICIHQRRGLNTDEARQEFGKCVNDQSRLFEVSSKTGDYFKQVEAL